MRLHQISITAFGPFAGTAEIDFDALSAGGLFLLTGATGAGKTSVLDAVCFALYGQVPGDRAGAKHLRSDHAEPQVEPRVALRLSIAERQFLFTRSPAWSRPKLRGLGVTRVQAHVLVEELREGSWVTLTNRLDDAGLLVSDLLGMTCTQFTQVAMLPQGRFQAFLRATSAERHAVLQQLFRTDRFERVEQWLVERRTAARRASEAGSERVLEVVNRLREAAPGEHALDWLDDLGEAAESGAVTSWAAEVHAETQGLASSTETASNAADEALAARTGALAAAQRTVDLRARGADARRQLARVAARAVQLDEDRLMLSAHRRATGLSAIATSAASAVQSATTSGSRWDALRTAGGVPADLPREELGAMQRQAHSAHALAVAFEPRARARRDALDRCAQIRNRLHSVEEGLAELELAIKERPAVIADAVAAVHEARAAAGRLPLEVAKVDQLDALCGAARRAEVVGLELVASRTDVLLATEVAQAARERHLDMREARINGMAGELAGQLASGCTCPVCGSADHPSPARFDSTGIGRRDEDRARKDHEDAAFDLQARQVGLATLEGELSSLDEQLRGHDRDLLRGALAAARDEVERLEPLVAALDVLVAREAECRERLLQAGNARSNALLERAALSTEEEQIAANLTGIDAEWKTLLDQPGRSSRETPGTTPEDLVRLRAAFCAELDGCTEAYDAWAQARERATSTLAEADTTALAAGFASTAEALAALLPPDAAAACEARIADAEKVEHAAAATLAEPGIAEAVIGAEPDLRLVGEQHTAAVEHARVSVSARDRAALRLERVAALRAQVEAGLAAWAPRREHHRTVAALAALVEGKSLDNPLRMRLAAYVLAERLKQVVAAANERLAGMTDQRYALEHTDDRGYGEQRGGLSLRVRDDWNGVHRDPATLSGGETFVVSLALALGLADTVAHEAGGTDIDTLFIDEGFGSLDADTLEDVMDTLDSLRDGGRVVGLVSHVPELRSRITTQLEVLKGRTGSSVRAAFADG